MQQYYPQQQQQQQQGVYPPQVYHSPSSSLDGVPPSATGTGSMSPSGSYYTHIPPADPHFVQQAGQFPTGLGVPLGAGTAVGVGRGLSLSSSHGGQSTNSSSHPTHTTHSGVHYPVGPGAGAGAKDREAFGAAALAPPPTRPLGMGLGVTNPDLGEASASTGGVDREAYLKNGPGPVLVPGPGPIVHQDAGRVEPVGEEEREATREEIPPTYDSLPVDERR